MSPSEKMETKEKIIQVASELFSRYGFEGTSVRDIASQSGVNVASVNYHFGSKHNLYWATVDEKHDWLDEGLKQLAAENKDVGDLIVKGYQMLMSDPAAIRTTMKMMLTDGVPEPEGELREKMMSQMGPPGATHLREVLLNCMPDDVSEEMLQWGVKSLFAALIHWAMMNASCKFEILREQNPDMFGPEGVEHMLRHQAQAILAYMKSRKDL